MEPRSAITIGTDLPPVQQDSDVPHGTIVADMSGHREPPAEDADDAAIAEQEKQRFTTRDVSATNYDEAVLVWEPRFKATLPDLLTGEPNRTLKVDVRFKGRSKMWPGEIDKGVPEIVAIDKLIAQLERLQSTLARKTVLRDQLDKLLHVAITKPNSKSAHAPTSKKPKAKK